MQNKHTKTLVYTARESLLDGTQVQTHIVAASSGVDDVKNKHTIGPNSGISYKYIKAS